MTVSKVEIIQESCRLWTTSLDVAEKFGKRHDQVLRSIENLESSKSFNVRNFVEIGYLDSRGRKQRAYRMTRSGFSILVMGFTGRKAMEWKECYIAAFDAMERNILRHGQALRRQATFQWQQAREQGKHVRLQEAAIIKTFVDYSARQGSRNAERYFVNLTRMVYKELFTWPGDPPPDRLREFMTQEQLAQVATAEGLVCQELRKGMEEGATTAASSKRPSPEWPAWRQ